MILRFSLVVLAIAAALNFIAVVASLLEGDWDWWNWINLTGGVFFATLIAYDLKEEGCRPTSKQ